MASPVAVDRRAIRVITGWHLPGRDHNDNGRFAGRLHPTCCLHRARGALARVLSCTVSFGRINSHPLALHAAPSIPAGASRYAALVIRYLLLTGETEITSRSGDRARVRWLRSIEKAVTLFRRAKSRGSCRIRKKGM